MSQFWPNQGAGHGWHEYVVSLMLEHEAPFWQGFELHRSTRKEFEWKSISDVNNSVNVHDNTLSKKSCVSLKTANTHWLRNLFRRIRHRTSRCRLQLWMEPQEHLLCMYRSLRTVLSHKDLKYTLILLGVALWTLLRKFSRAIKLKHCRSIRYWQVHVHVPSHVAESA